jgi:hypothetical protein
MLKERRTSEGAETTDGCDLPPVHDVRQRRHHVASQLVAGVGHEERGVGTRDEQHDVEGREQTATPPHPEPAQIDVARGAPFLDQERRDEVTRYDEEHLNAEKAARDPVEAGVVEDHAEHRKRPQAIEPGLIVERAGVLRGGHRTFSLAPRKGPVEALARA